MVCVSGFVRIGFLLHRVEKCFLLGGRGLLWGVAEILGVSGFRFDGGLRGLWIYCFGRAGGERTGGFGI